MSLLTEHAKARHSSRLIATGLLLIHLSIGPQAIAFGTQRKDEGEFSRYVGDSPSTALPYAKDLSSDLTSPAVAAVLKKVADWQLRRSEKHFDRDWTFNVLYAGFMEIPPAVAGEKYHDAMRSMGRRFQWSLNPIDLTDRNFANDQSLAQTYLELYRLDHDPEMLRPVRDQVDGMLENVHPQDQLVWWWCDALFMAPSVLANLSDITHDPRYLNYMDREWWRTSNVLYDNNRHLFYRDVRFFERRELNGQPVFWARGNGWVLAGLARILEAMPRDYPSRPRYVIQFQQMAAALAALQSEDGLWRSGLLDPGAHPTEETSGTSLITYGLAYGVNAGLLDRSQFEPHVQKAWRALVAHIYADGRLGSIQPVADSPGRVFKPTSSYVYGVGAFLLAGSEIHRMADKSTAASISNQAGSSPAQTNEK